MCGRENLAFSCSPLADRGKANNAEYIFVGPTKPLTLVPYLHVVTVLRFQLQEESLSEAERKFSLAVIGRTSYAYTKR